MDLSWGNPEAKNMSVDPHLGQNFTARFFTLERFSAVFSIIGHALIGIVFNLLVVKGAKD